MVRALGIAVLFAASTASADMIGSIPGTFRNLGAADAGVEVSHANVDMQGGSINGSRRLVDMTYNEACAMVDYQILEQLTVKFKLGTLAGFEVEDKALGTSWDFSGNRAAGIGFGYTFEEDLVAGLRTGFRGMYTNVSEGDDSNAYGRANGSMDATEVAAIFTRVLETDRPIFPYIGATASWLNAEVSSALNDGTFRKDSFSQKRSVGMVGGVDVGINRTSMITVEVRCIDQTGLSLGYSYRF